MIDANSLLIALAALFVAGLVTGHRTGWLSSTILDHAPRRRLGRRQQQRRILRSRHEPR